MATDNLFNKFNFFKVEVLDYLIHKVKKYIVTEKSQVKKE